ncbi:Fic/DOC family protein [Paramicrobacterium agarici]|uniref:protein adenylyltransferase n=1 Tax=Paramicrobacterium agarici TaxID=630514 RepID=A0A2A9DUA9_9MICO|nr:Fic family protein [Microbacterium agarici]PFG29745.1 cell filamentation protein [Microbacterium agarici]
MPKSRPFRSWDDYYIPGTSVLKNKLTKPGKPFGETDASALQSMEEAVAAVRLAELAVRPVDGAFDYDHMKAIHRYIFQDVYEWAGQERVGPVGAFMVKDGHAYYGAGPHLTEAAELQYARLAEKDFLRGLTHEQFATELAEIWGELNVIHSFHEGNTRSQFVFFSQLTENAGFVLDAKRLGPGTELRDEFIDARFHSQDSGSNERLADVLKRSIR